MTFRRKMLIGFCLGAVVTSLVILTGCALSNYIAKLEEASTTTETSSPDLPAIPTLTPFTPDTPTLTLSPTPTATFTITPTATTEPCTATEGSIVEDEIPSNALGVPLPVTLYLPPCYDSNGNYPVLYLLHGQGMDDQYWISLGVKAIADTAIRHGQTPFIMVFPREERYLDDNTTSKFPDAIVEDLIPWIDSNFATCTQRICRAIGGISRGGGWAIKITMHHLDLFGSLGGHSYGLMYGDADWVRKNLETYSLSDFPRMYLDRGDQDSLANDIDYFVKVLQANGIRPEFHIYQGGHTRSYWSTHVQEYMHFYMDAWPEPYDQP